MTKSGLAYRTYRWRGEQEWLTEVGEGPAILIAPPLFEELNRCRALLMAIMRRLADAGFKSVLPDLPGTGESERAIGEIGLADWAGAFAAVASEYDMPRVAAFRGGSLVSGAGAAWRLSPVAGAALARDLVRARRAAGASESGAAIEAAARERTIEFAGYPLPPALFASLSAASPPVDLAGSRTVRLDTDPAEADLKLPGKPLWRQSEPGNDLALAARLAADIADWARACES